MFAEASELSVTANPDLVIILQALLFDLGFDFACWLPAESALGEGDTIMRAKKLIADEKTAGDVTVSFKVRDWPNDSETTYGPYTIDNPTNIRFAARQARLVVTGSAASGWRWGVPRVDTQAGGRR